ncbi:reverse transcriptase, partial [Globisporangium splendens]
MNTSDWTPDYLPMRDTVGRWRKAIFAILATCPPEQHRLTAIGFLQKEAEERGREATRAVTAQVQHPRQKDVKLDVAKYGGGDKEPLDFAMSKLAGRAKSRAFGRRMADHHCFRTLAEFKSDIRAAFEPPKSEFRTRTEFLEIRQDRRDLHAYIQHARYLVSSIVSEPIDMATQVATFMKGLTDGPVKTYLFREYPETLEQAIALALQEDFSTKQARLHANPLCAAQFRHAKPSPPRSSRSRNASNGSFAQWVVTLRVMSQKRFMKELHRGTLEQICYIAPQESSNAESAVQRHPLDECFLASSSVMDTDVLDEPTKKERFQAQGWEALKDSPFYGLLKEYEDVFPEEVPSRLPTDKGVRHEIDLKPGTKYCVTRQWPLPREQVKVIDEFFEARRKAGQVRESNSPHCSPTFCVKKATGGWRIVHALNKLNAATIPAQTPIPRKDVIIDSMQGSTILSTIDLRDGFYQILMREKDIPLTAVSTPSGMLWEWLVMPQGLTNAPATFSRCVTQLLRPVRDFAPSYFDDVFIHSRASDATPDVEVHKEHLRQLLDLMRKYKLYANIQKCMFGVDEIPVLGCFVGKNGVRPDPEKIKVINDWPVPTSQKDLRKFLGLATYLHKYSQNYAGIIRRLSSLLKKDVDWKWSDECQDAFVKVKSSLVEAPVLAIADHERPFYVVCDASDFAIGCALMQRGDADRERVICYQSRQLKPAERNYPVHDKELLAMKHALTKFRVYLLGSKRFTVCTDHASLRTTVESPHLSQRMARWLSFFAEYEFDVEYKPGRFSVIADALSRRPDFESKANDSKEDRVVTITRESTPTSSLLDDVKRAYATDSDISRLVTHLSDPSDKSLKALDPAQRARLHRYELHNDVLYYRTDGSDVPRAVVPNDSDLRNRVLFEYHDTPFRGHPGREKTYLALSRDFYWSHQYKWVHKHVRACEVCQRVKPAPVTNAPLRPLPVPTDCWKSVSMDFIFGLPADSSKKTGILVIVDRFSKMVHLSAVPASVTAKQTAQIFLDSVFRLHGMPTEIVSDRDPRFTAAFWQELFRLLGTQLKISTADHPQTDGQTERVNRTLEDILRSYAHSFTHWNECLLSQSLQSTTLCMSQPGTRHSTGGGVREAAAVASEHSETPHQREQVTAHAAIADKDIATAVLQRQAVIRFVRDSIADAVDTQKEQADKSGRKNTVVSSDSNKLLPRYIGPFKVLERIGDAYTLELPPTMRLHPTFYVGSLKAYHRHDDSLVSSSSGDRGREGSQAQACDQPRASRAVPRAARASRSSRLARPEVGEPRSPAQRASADQEDADHSEDAPQSHEQIFPPPAPPLRDSEGNQRWIVEKILAHRDRSSRGKKERVYRIRWLGYPPDRDTWEPAAMLQADVPGLVQQYESRR